MAPRLSSDGTLVDDSDGPGRSTSSYPTSHLSRVRYVVEWRAYCAEVWVPVCGGGVGGIKRPSYVCQGGMGDPRAFVMQEAKEMKEERTMIR